MTCAKPKPPREIWVVQWTHVNGPITLGAYPSKDRADAWEACIRAMHTTDVLARGRYVLADAPSRKPRKRTVKRNLTVAARKRKAGKR